MPPLAFHSRAATAPPPPPPPPPLLLLPVRRSLPANLLATHHENPHSAEPPEEMGGNLGFVKTIVIPAAISLVLYLVLTHAVLPFVRRHRQRYAQYLPVAPPASLPRLRGAVSSLLVPRGWARRAGPVSLVFFGRGGAEEGDAGSSVFDEEDGEDMVGLVVDERRREALERGVGGVGDAERRLSRDLEEGFRDDSSEEGEVVGR